MKNNVFLALFAIALALSPLALKPASALSCLSVEMYLEDIAGNEEILIFTGTSKEKMEGDSYTAEVITVDEVLQGYTESEVFVYHQKDETWGYFCNAGPKDEGTKGLYIAEKNKFGKYTAHQRLELDDPLIEGLRKDLAEKEIIGNKGELAQTDRLNQIMTTVNELIAEISVMLREYIYWKSN